MSFWDKILDSIAKKFDSILNKPFENKFTWSIFALGSALITSSTVYSFTTRAKAELKVEGYNFVLELVSGPEVIPTIIGTILVGFSIAIFWKTKIPKQSSVLKSEFDNIVANGIHNYSDYEIEKAFRFEFNYLISVKNIKWILEMNDSLSKFLDYKKSINYLEVASSGFTIKNTSKLRVTSAISLVLYFLFAFMCVASMQLIIWSVKADSLGGVFLFSIFTFSLGAVSISNLNTYSGTASARRLAENTVT